MTPPKPPRPPTHSGDRNEDRRRVDTRPRGVGLTPPFPIGELAVPQVFTEPEKTDVTIAPSPELLETRRKRTTAEQLERVLDYHRDQARYRHQRELRELDERKAARRARFIIGVITAVGGAIAAIVAAVQ